MAPPPSPAPRHDLEAEAVWADLPSPSGAPQPRVKPAPPLTSERDADALEPGDVVSHLGKSFVWTDGHLKPHALEPMRRVGDELADDAIAAVMAEKRSGPSKAANERLSSPGRVFRWLGQPAARPSLEDGEDLVAAAARAAARGDEAAKAFMEAVTTWPAWGDAERCVRGGRFFLSFVPGSFATLFHLSLVGGYAARRIARVLGLASKLNGSETQRDKDRAFRRLLDTSMMVLQCVNGAGSLEPRAGKGWHEVVRVRLLHAAVRSRVRKHPNGYDESTDGVPVNQEDLLVTQLAFSAVMLGGLARLGVDVAREHRQDAEDFLHLWRVVGFFMGIHDENNWACRSLDDARLALQSIWVHLAHPDEVSRRLTASSLRALVGRPPQPWTAAQLARGTRFLQGDALADALGVDAAEDDKLVHVLLRHTRVAHSWLDAHTSCGRALQPYAASFFEFAFRGMSSRLLA